MGLRPWSSPVLRGAQQVQDSPCIPVGEEATSGRETHLGLWMAAAQPPCLPFQHHMHHGGDVVCVQETLAEWTMYIRVSRCLTFSSLLLTVLQPEASRDCSLLGQVCELN